MMGVAVEMPKRIGEALLDKRIQPSTFFWQKTRKFGIAHRIMNIDGFMTDIIISTNHQIGVRLFERIDIRLKVIHIGKLKRQTLGIRSRWQIQTHDRNIFKIDTEVASFSIHIFDACTIGNVFGFLFAQYCYPTVPLFLGGIPIVVVIA